MQMNCWPASASGEGRAVTGDHRLIPLVVLAMRFTNRRILTLDRRHFDVLRPLDGGRLTIVGG